MKDDGWLNRNCDRGAAVISRPESMLEGRELQINRGIGKTASCEQVDIEVNSLSKVLMRLAQLVDAKAWPQTFPRHSCVS